MPKINREIEDRILKALESPSEQSNLNIARTAREIAVPDIRLRRR